MAYSVEDIAELVRHHLVFAESDEQKASENLRQLVAQIETMGYRRTCEPIERLFCDACGCTVYTDVLAEDGSNFTSDGGFYCSDCRAT